MWGPKEEEMSALVTHGQSGTEQMIFDLGKNFFLSEVLVHGFYHVATMRQT